MSQDFKIYNGTPIVWNAAASNYAMTIASCTTATTDTAWQGAKGDLLTPRGALMAVRFQTQFDTAPTAGNRVEVWWAPSPASTAASSNPGNVSGLDAVYAGYTGGTIAQSKNQLQYVGSIVLDATTSQQAEVVGYFTPVMEYGSFVVVNLAGQKFATSTTAHVLTVYPVIDQAP